jgi:hypothetical protein
MKKLSLWLLLIQLIVVIALGVLLKPTTADNQGFWLSVGWTCTLVVASWIVTGLYLYRDAVDQNDEIAKSSTGNGVVPSIVIFVNLYCFVSFALLWGAWISVNFSQLPSWHWIAQIGSFGAVSIVTITTMMASIAARIPANEDLPSKDTLLKKIHTIKTSLPTEETAILAQLKELEATIRYFVPHLSKVVDPTRYQSLGDEVLGIDTSLDGHSLAEFLRVNVQRWVSLAKSCQ